MWATLQGTVRFLAGQGVPVMVAREGELAGVLRIPYGRSPAGHPWRAALGLLWDGGEMDYLAWYAITPDGSVSRRVREAQRRTGESGGS